MNHHGTALLIGDRGVVISGEPGSGKTQLATALINQLSATGVFARLVADDQLWLSAANGRLLCEAPEAIAGRIELRGLGIAATNFEPTCIVHLVVRLVRRELVERLPELNAGRDRVGGIELPCIELPCHETAGNTHTIIAACGYGGFIV